MIIVASINFWFSNKCVLDKFAVIVDSAVDVLHEIHRVEEAGIPTEWDIDDDDDDYYYYQKALNREQIWREN